MAMWRYFTAVVICCLGGVSLKADDATFNAGTGANALVVAGAAPFNGEDAGTVSPYFNTTNGPAVWTEPSVLSSVLSVLPLRAGQVVVGGRFTQVEGTNWAHLARLNEDGSLDRSYTARPNRPVYTMLEQPDGRVLIGGEFNVVNGQFRDRVARLEADGRLDTNFQTRLGLNGTVYSMALQPDGKLILGGVFSIPLPGGGYLHHVARLETNGAVDFSFNAGTNFYAANVAMHFVRAVMLLPGGNILAGGTFHREVGSTRDYLARLLPDGSLDTSYDRMPSAGPDGPVYSLTRAPSGLIYAGGSFTSFNGLGMTNLARLSPDGSLDERFRAQPTSQYSGGMFNAIIADPAGRAFVARSADGVNIAPSWLYCYQPDGSILTNFTSPVLYRGGSPWAGINCMAGTPDGGIYLGGNFDGVLGLAGIRPSIRKGVALLLGEQPGPPVVLASPKTTTQEGGQYLQLTASTTLSTRTDFQWFLNGDAVPGETNAFLIRSEADPSMAGEYWLVASNQFGMSTSAVATVTVRRVGRPGSVVRSFIASPGPNSGVSAMVESGDGKIYVGGSFTNYHGVERIRTARINEDGDLDATFAIAESAGNWLGTTALGLMPDGRLVVGGSAYHYYAPVRRYLADGAWDPSWNFQSYVYPPSSGNYGSTPPSVIEAIALDQQGRIYAGGTFGSVLISGALDRRFRYCMRLFSDGALDPSFKVDMPQSGVFGFNYPASIFGMALDPDENPLIWGDLNLMHTGSLVPDLAVYRLNSAGLMDSRQNYSPNGIGVESVIVLFDGGLLMAGWFSHLGSNSVPHFARFFADGTHDASFQPWSPPIGYAYQKALALQADGKILATIYSNQSSDIAYPYTNRLVRLNSNGSLDASFDVGDGPNGYISSALIRSDGNILVGGRFSRFSGFYCNNIALLHGGSPQPPSVPQASESKTVVAGEVLRLSALVEGFPPPRLQWLKNGVAISGATQQFFRSRSAGMDDAGVYSLVASNASGISTSIVATVSVQAGRLNSDWVDSGFSAESEPNGEVHVIVPQPDGRILIGGQFTRVGNVPRSGIARLLADGSLDGSFNTSTNFADYSIEGSVTVSQIVLLPDGKVAVGRSFSEIYGSRQNATLRLHEDGRVDTSFTNLANRIPLLAMPDGRLLVGRGAPALQMLAPDGTVDNSFVAATNLGVFISRASLLADGRILISPEGSGTLERLMPDGSRDESFARYAANLNSGSSSDICFPNPGGAIPSAYVLAHAVQPDGKILIGGVFSKYLNRYTANLIRLLPSGEIDPGFNAWSLTDFAVRAVAIQPDGRILIGGCFTSVGEYPAPATRLHLARLNPDGSVDATFNPAPTLRGTSSGHVRAMALQPDGRLLIGGMFDSVNGATRRNLARLNGELVMFQTASGDAEFSTRVATVEGRTYFLELRASLDDGNWVVVDSAVGTGEAARLTHSSHGGETRYYRVRAE